METYGAVDGVTLERVRQPWRGELSALLSGSRHDGHVTFTKAYDAAAHLDLAPVAYTGSVDRAFMLMQGEWRLVSHEELRGGFIMRRVSSHRVFGLRGRQESPRAKWLTNEEVRARQEAIRRRQISIVKPRRRPKP